MCCIICNSNGDFLKNQKILMLNDYNCVINLQEKLIIRPSVTNVVFISPILLKRIQGDISNLFILLNCKLFIYLFIIFLWCQ